MQTILLRQLLITVCLLMPSALFGTTLEDLRPHHPSSDKTWAEQWFYNVGVPGVGLFKISLQTYIAPDFKQANAKAYIHLAFTPLQGKTVKYDIFRDDLILRGYDDAEQFHYEVPGIVVANNDMLTVTHDNFHFTMRWNGEHAHYWHGSNPGQTPFSFVPELPGVGGKWFLYTVGTPVLYRFSDGEQSLSGTGYTQLDKGWYDKESSNGMIYSMGVSDDLHYMLTGAKVGTSSIEMWGGRYISKDHDLIFYPTFNNLTVKREYDSCAGYLKVEMRKLRYKMVMEARSALSDFYSQAFPSVIIFGGEQKYMKSMKAAATFTLYQGDELAEVIQMPQVLLEFSGPFYCDEMPPLQPDN